jgi:hypothetical protein
MIEKARHAVSNERTSSDTGRSGGSFPADNRDPIPNTLLSEWAWPVGSPPPKTSMNYRRTPRNQWI